MKNLIKNLLITLLVCVIGIAIAIIGALFFISIVCFITWDFSMLTEMFEAIPNKDYSNLSRFIIIVYLLILILVYHARKKV